MFDPTDRLINVIHCRTETTASGSEVNMLTN